MADQSVIVTVWDLTAPGPPVDRTPGPPPGLDPRGWGRGEWDARLRCAWMSHVQVCQQVTTYNPHTTNTSTYRLFYTV